MGMQFEQSHLAIEALGLYESYEAENIRRTEMHEDEAEIFAHKMGQLGTFLEEVSKSTKESNRIDWNDDPVRHAQVDALRETFPSLFEHGVYAWKDKEVDKLVERINGHINRELKPQIESHNTKIVRLLHEGNEVLMTMSDAIKTFNDLIKLIQRNIQQGRM